MVSNSSSSCSNIRLLEHVNLNITDEEEAVSFYVNRLGFTYNRTFSSALTKEEKPRRRQIHVNAGLSQLHCSFRDPDGTPVSPQVLSGRIGLHVESLATVEARLREFGNDVILESGPEEITARGPNGNIFSITEGGCQAADIMKLGGHDGGVGKV